VKLHFGDEQFEVDAAQLSIAFAEVTLGVRERENRNGDERKGGICFCGGSGVLRAGCTKGLWE
jgi:hypothetical protein